MRATLRNILATLAGIAAGSAVNMALVHAGALLLPPPAGVDVNDLESINAHIGEYSVPQLLAPFAAHALGAFAGAWVAATLAAARRLVPACIVGGFFLLGGTMAIRMIPDTPTWFAVLDLGAGYVPAALAGWWLAERRAKARRSAPRRT